MGKSDGVMVNDEVLSSSILLLVVVCVMCLVVSWLLVLVLFFIIMVWLSVVFSWGVMVWVMRLVLLLGG